MQPLPPPPLRQRPGPTSTPREETGLFACWGALGDVFRRIFGAPGNGPGPVPASNPSGHIPGGGDGFGSDFSRHGPPSSKSRWFFTGLFETFGGGAADPFGTNDNARRRELSVSGFVDNATSPRDRLVNTVHGAPGRGGGDDGARQTPSPRSLMEQIRYLLVQMAMGRALTRIMLGEEGPPGRRWSRSVGSLLDTEFTTMPLSELSRFAAGLDEELQAFFAATAPGEDFSGDREDLLFRDACQLARRAASNTGAWSLEFREDLASDLAFLYDRLGESPEVRDCIKKRALAFVLEKMLHWGGQQLAARAALPQNSRLASLTRTPGLAIIFPDVLTAVVPSASTAELSMATARVYAWLLQRGVDIFCAPFRPEAAYPGVIKLDWTERLVHLMVYTTFKRAFQRAEGASGGAGDSGGGGRRRESESPSGMLPPASPSTGCAAPPARPPARPPALELRGDAGGRLRAQRGPRSVEEMGPLPARWNEVCSVANDQVQVEARLGRRLEESEWEEARLDVRVTLGAHFKDLRTGSFLPSFRDSLRRLRDSRWYDFGQMGIRGKYSAGFLQHQSLTFELWLKHQVKELSRPTLAPGPSALPQPRASLGGEPALRARTGTGTGRRAPCRPRRARRTTARTTARSRWPPRTARPRAAPAPASGPASAATPRTPSPSAPALPPARLLGAPPRPPARTSPLLQQRGSAGPAPPPPLAFAPAAGAGPGPRHLPPGSSDQDPGGWVVL
eukprot:tig00000514_g1799.t1